MDTLAFDYAIPAIRACSGLPPVRQCSCRAYTQKGVSLVYDTPFLYSQLITEAELYISAVELSISEAVIYISAVEFSISETEFSMTEAEFSISEA